MTARQRQLKRGISYFLDIDGTLDTGTKGEIHPDILELLAIWVCRGANLIFVTNRPRTWVAQNLLVPLGRKLTTNPVGSVFAVCEQGCIASHVSLAFDGPEITDLRVWQLGQRLRNKIVTVLKKSICSLRLKGRFRDGLEHQVCVENVSVPPTEEPSRLLPESIRRQVRVISTRSTVSIIPRRAGKAVAVRFLLKSFSEIDRGNKLGFGDDGDEYASLFDVIDVDRYRRNTFLRSGLAATLCYDLEAVEDVTSCSFDSPVLRDKLLRGGGDATAAVLEGMLTAT